MPGKGRGLKAPGAGFGTSTHESLVKWDRATLSWRTCEPSLLAESTAYSARWPTSGMMQSGQLYVRPTWVPRTDASASSSSRGWPTPRNCSAMAAEFTEEAISKAVKRFPNLESVVQTWASPRTSDGNGAGAHGDGGKDPRTMVKAWATPTTRDYKDTGDLSGSAFRADGTPGDDTAPRQAQAWAGQTPPPYEAQTEPLGSSQPKPRRWGLNPRFTLWLMGLPVAWID